NEQPESRGHGRVLL
nr:immunoglobulin heavy chain junction region [Homo sapiens]